MHSAPSRPPECEHPCLCLLHDIPLCFLVPSSRVTQTGFRSSTGPEISWKKICHRPVTQTPRFVGICGKWSLNFDSPTKVLVPLTSDLTPARIEWEAQPSRFTQFEIQNSNLGNSCPTLESRRHLLLMIAGKFFFSFGASVPSSSEESIPKTSASESRTAVTVGLEFDASTNVWFAMANLDSASCNDEPPNEWFSNGDQSLRDVTMWDKYCMFAAPVLRASPRDTTCRLQCHLVEYTLRTGALVWSCWGPLVLLSTWSERAPTSSNWREPCPPYSARRNPQNWVFCLWCFSVWGWCRAVYCCDVTNDPFGVLNETGPQGGNLSIDTSICNWQFTVRWRCTTHAWFVEHKRVNLWNQNWEVLLSLRTDNYSSAENVSTHRKRNGDWLWTASNKTNRWERKSFKCGHVDSPYVLRHAHSQSIVAIWQVGNSLMQSVRWVILLNCHVILQPQTKGWPYMSVFWTFLHAVTRDTDVLWQFCTFPSAVTSNILGETLIHSISLCALKSHSLVPMWITDHHARLLWEWNNMVALLVKQHSAFQKPASKAPHIRCTCADVADSKHRLLLEKHGACWGATQHSSWNHSGWTFQKLHIFSSCWSVQQTLSMHTD